MNIDSPSVSVLISRIWDQKMLMQRKLPEETQRSRKPADGNAFGELIYGFHISTDQNRSSRRLVAT